MEFSIAINEDGILYVPYAEVKEQEEVLKEELKVYKKALETACKDIAKSHPILFALGYDYYQDRYLQKAREE